MGVWICTYPLSWNRQNSKGNSCHPEGWHQPAHITRPLAPSQDSTWSLLGSFWDRWQTKCYHDLHIIVYYLCVFLQVSKPKEIYVITMSFFAIACFHTILLSSHFLQHFYSFGQFQSNSPLRPQHFVSFSFLEGSGRQKTVLVYCIKRSDQMLCEKWSSCAGWQKSHPGWKRP